jgi:hypothetical protein
MAGLHRTGDGNDEDDEQNEQDEAHVAENQSGEGQPSSLLTGLIDPAARYVSHNDRRYPAERPDHELRDAAD